MSSKVSPGLGRVMAALGTAREGGPITAPAAPAALQINPQVVKARSKFTPELAKKILSIVQAGNCREVACASAGVTLTTLTHWLKMAADGEEPFVAFSEQLDQTEASLEAILVASLRQKAQEDPNVAFRLLERRFPQRWAPNAQPAVNINMAQQQMTPADARQVMRDLFGDLSPKKVIDVPAEEPKDEK